MVDGNGRRFCLDVEHRGIPELRTHLQTARRLVRRGSAPAAVAVAAEGTAQTGEEGEEECDEGTKDEPVGVAPGCVDAAVAHVVARNAEQNHLDNPGDEGDEEGEGTEQGHEDSASAVVGRSTETEENGQARKSSAYR